MTITIDASTLLSYYQARSGVTSAGSGASSSGTTSTTQPAPTPPWSSTSTAAKQSALTSAVLAGSRFINPTAAQLTVQGTNSDNYKNLFALYQGVSALQGIATAASASNVSAGDLATYQSRFAAGLKEVDGFLASAPFTGFTVAQGQVAATQTSTVTIPHQNSNYQTAPIYTGPLSGDVPAFDGDVSFSLKLTKPSGSASTVNFDLSDLGATPRTLPNVVNYLNAKLQAAGVSTRFANVRIPATPTTIKSGTSTITLPAGQDSFALKIVGTSAEIPTFTATASDPAVYVTSTAGRTAAQATTALPADSTIQLAKFDGGQDPATEADGTTKIAGHTLPANVSAVRSTATAPDGSLYVLADLTGPAPDGEPIKGTQDVALLKYDSAGNLQFSRTLGASDSASGYALAVSSDGKSIAVAGTSQSALDGANGTTFINSATTNTFTSVFTSAGDESWTTQRTGSVGDQPTAVTFAPDGSVYVVGKTNGSVQGGTAIGGGDAWLQAFSKTGSPTYTSEIGTSALDKAAGVSADANGVVVAAVENGHAVLQRYDFNANGALQQGASTDLGDLQGGDIAGLGRADDGSLIIAGSTHNGALGTGAAQSAAYDQGRQAFVATIASDLSTVNTLSFVGLRGDVTTSGLTVSGGQAYITGQLSQPDGVLQGYAAAVDPTTGVVGWHDTINGADGLDAPASIAVAQGGASVLDKLGLPNGTITYSGATSSAAADGSLTLSGPGSTLIANTSVRAGDQFLVRSGKGAAVPVTIEATDTLNTLATKINRALGFTGKAEVVSVSGGFKLKISPASSHTAIQIESGPAGKNALSALGLSEGLILNQGATTSTSTSTSTSSTSSSSSSSTTTPTTYGLKLSSTLSIASPTAAKQAAVLLGSAQTTLTLAYSDLAFPSSGSSSAKPGNNTPLSAAESAYYSARISDYQLALSKLTGTG